MTRHIRLLALLAVLALVIAACGDGDTADTTEGTAAAETTTTEAAVETTEAMVDTTEATTETTEAMVDAEAITACQVTDTGGIDDKSFNQTAWKGVTDAQADGLATEDSDFVESQVEADYAPNIQSMIDKGCDLVITVGFLLGGATGTAAAANPDQKFEIIDFPVGDAPPFCTGEAQPGEDGELGTFDDTCGGEVTTNVLGTLFRTDQASFLAGYLAAGVSQTGVVATYGGIQIPTVTPFMDGFAWGVDYYNQQKGTDVTVLGWDPDAQTGVFTGDFENQANGRNVTQSFIDEGADVILPVAGPVGEGSAALAQELGNVWVIGVDADWFETLPQYSDIVLTSVLKGLDVAVYTAIEEVATDTFEGGITRTFEIAENGVGLGPVNETVDSALVAEVEAVKQGLIDGSIVAGG